MKHHHIQIEAKKNKKPTKKTTTLSKQYEKEI